MHEILSVILRNKERYLVTHLTSEARRSFSGVPSALPGGRQGAGTLIEQVRRIVNSKFGLNISNPQIIASRRHVLAPDYHITYISATLVHNTSDRIRLNDKDVATVDWLKVSEALEAMPTLYTKVVKKLLLCENSEEGQYAFQNIHFFGQLVREGKLVAFPTETVYGLGANALDQSAVSSIFAAKGRPADNPLIVHVASKKQIKKYVTYIPRLAQKLYEVFAPGPITILLKRKPIIPDVVTAALPLVGVRIPNNSLALELIDAAKVPIAAPSANKSGKPSATHHEHVLEAFKDDAVHVLKGGSTREGVESTVVRVHRRSIVILRQGAISKEDIAQALPYAKVVIAGTDDAALAASPGTRYKHYAPKGSVHIVPYSPHPSVIAHAMVQKLQSYSNAFVIATDDVLADVPPSASQFSLGFSHQDAKSAAQRLYAALLTADNRGAEHIIIQSFSESGVGRTVMERIKRAAQSEREGI